MRTFVIWYNLFVAGFCFAVSARDMVAHRWVWAIIQLCLALINLGCAKWLSKKVP